VCVNFLIFAFVKWRAQSFYQYYPVQIGTIKKTFLSCQIQNTVGAHRSNCCCCWGVKTRSCACLNG